MAKVCVQLALDIWRHLLVNVDKRTEHSSQVATAFEMEEGKIKLKMNLFDFVTFPGENKESLREVEINTSQVRSSALIFQRNTQEDFSERTPT